MTRTFGALVVVLSMAAFADEQRQHHHRGPPKEALAACAGSSRGAACAFTIDSKNVIGTCDAPPDVTTLACRPEGGPGGGHGHHRGPPQEAVAACTGLSRGAACQFTMDSKNLTGTCGAPPDVTTLACRPEGGPGGGHGHHRGPPQEAIDACAKLAANAACSFTRDSETITGTCFTPPNGGAAACRPVWKK